MKEKLSELVIAMLTIIGGLTVAFWIGFLLMEGPSGAWDLLRCLAVVSPGGQ